MRPSVSLLIPNKNNELALDLVFERLAEHTTYRDVEVVVVDDGSSDGSRPILRRWRDSGRFERFVYEEREPSGVVVTLNRGLELASGDVVVQLDADATIETPSWLEKMLAFFCSDHRIGVVSPKIAFDTGRVHAFGVNLVGPGGMHDRGTRILEPVGARTLHQKVERPRWQDAPYGERIAEVDAGIGCCMMYRREDALAVGGYDLGYQPVWFDDIDLALSIRHKLGKKAFFFPHVFVTHRVSLRNERHQPSRREVFQARVGARLPPRLKAALTERGIGEPETNDRLRHHYAYWESKWGWHPLNPDMAAVRRRYGDTEVCWASDAGRREAGEAIALHAEALRDTGSSTYAQAFLRRFGFLPPPQWTTTTSYAPILEVIQDEGLADLDGDFVEIGAFLGGGVYQLARLAPRRRVLAVDLGEGDQRELFDAVTAGLANVEVVAGDPAGAELPTERIAFAHVDGNHSAAYVRSDFERLWPLVVPGGVVAFDDYGHDLETVTRTVDRLRAEHAGEIDRFWTGGRKTAFLKRR